MKASNFYFHCQGQSVKLSHSENAVHYSIWCMDGSAMDKDNIVFHIDVNFIII